MVEMVPWGCFNLLNRLLFTIVMSSASTKLNLLWTFLFLLRINKFVWRERKKYPSIWIVALREWKKKKSWKELIFHDRTQCMINEKVIDILTAFFYVSNLMIKFKLERILHTFYFANHLLIVAWNCCNLNLTGNYWQQRDL